MRIEVMIADDLISCCWGFDEGEREKEQKTKHKVEKTTRQGDKERPCAEC